MFVTPYCGVLFHCGCRTAWAGGAEHCNINNEVPPYCPFCNHGTPGARFVRMWIIFAEALALAWALRRNWSWFRLTLLVMGVFLIAGAIGGVFFALYDGYCVPFTACWWHYYRM